MHHDGSTLSGDPGGAAPDAEVRGRSPPGQRGVKRGVGDAVRRRRADVSLRCQAGRGKRRGGVTALQSHRGKATWQCDCCWSDSGDPMPQQQARGPRQAPQPSHAHDVPSSRCFGLDRTERETPRGLLWQFSINAKVRLQHSGAMVMIH